MEERAPHNAGAFRDAFSALQSSWIKSRVSRLSKFHRQEATVRRNAQLPERLLTGWDAGAIGPFWWRSAGGVLAKRFAIGAMT